MNPLFSFEEILRVTGAVPVGPFDPGRTVQSVSTDTRADAPDSLFLALKGENFDAHDFLADAVSHGAVLLCVEKDSIGKVPEGVPALAVDSTVEAYRLLAKHHRMKYPSLETAALTGSCGKTSTKECLRAIFSHVSGTDSVLATEGNTNNHIGVPRNLLKLDRRHRYAVLELGTSHFGEILPLADAVRPHHAMIVSIRSSHIENFKTLEGTATEKSSIFRFLPPDGTGVIPFSCPGNAILRDALKGHRILTFGPEPEADFRATYLGGNLHGASFRLTRRDTGESALVNWSVPGAHQACNAAGAAALASCFGVTLADAAKGLESTTLPGMRMRIAEHSGATWINDAYNANPDSMRASLSWLAEFADPAKLVLILGDMVEQGEHALDAHRDVLTFARTAFPAARILAVGPMMCQAAETLRMDGEFTDSASAATGAGAFIRKGDTVFLKASRATKLEIVEP